MLSLVRKDAPRLKRREKDEGWISKPLPDSGLTVVNQEICKNNKCANSSPGVDERNCLARLHKVVVDRVVVKSDFSIRLQLRRRHQYGVKLPSVANSRKVMTRNRVSLDRRLKPRGDVEGKSLLLCHCS